jgi:hypothetical protein
MRENKSNSSDLSQGKIIIHTPEEVGNDSSDLYNGKVKLTSMKGNNNSLVLSGHHDKGRVKKI